MKKSVRAELDAIYAEVDREIAAAGPICRASGRCCRFQEYGHTLFLSRLEWERLSEAARPAGSVLSGETCPYQVQGLCTARAERPIGCRVYFCDPTFQESGRSMSERYIVRLKRLHDQLGMDWDYRPLHAFLAGNAEGDKRLGGAAELPVLRELP